MNVYRSGFYHRQGKPNTTNMHGGDLYATEAAALENAEVNRGYLGTAPVDFPMGGAPYVNGPDSTPTPLSVTRSYATRDAVILPVVAEHPQSIDASDDACLPNPRRNQRPGWPSH